MTPRSKEKLCNPECVEETERITGEKPEQVRDVMKFVWKYVRDVIDNGSLEEVYLYKFGRFRPRMFMIAGHVRKVSNKKTDQLRRQELERQAKAQRRKELEAEMKANKDGGDHAG